MLVDRAIEHHGRAGVNAAYLCRHMPEIPNAVCDLINPNPNPLNKASRDTHTRTLSTDMAHAQNPDSCPDESEPRAARQVSRIGIVIDSALIGHANLMRH